MKGTQAPDLSVKPKKATDPQTSTPTDILKEKSVQDLKSKLTTGEPEVASEGSSDSLPPTIPEIESLCALTVLDNLVPKGKIDDTVGKIKSCDMNHEHLVYLNRMSSAF